jgi:recombination protein RecT
MNTQIEKTEDKVSVKTYFAKEGVQKKFQELLGKKSTGFITSVMQCVNSNPLLLNATPESVYNSAAMAATLDLPINNNLGFAWIVPYNERFQDRSGQWQTKSVAQFQMGWKGFVQLANRTGQYKAINVLEVYENQFTSFNRLTEELKADFTKVGTGELVGVVAYFKLLNGFEKTSFWSVDEINAHGLKFSKTFSHKNSVWKTNFNAMAKKTVLKNTLSKWGILSIEMQNAIITDQSVINDSETMDVDYVDAGNGSPLEQMKEEVKAETMAEEVSFEAIEETKEDKKETKAEKKSAISAENSDFEKEETDEEPGF